MKFGTFGLVFGAFTAFGVGPVGSHYHGGVLVRSTRPLVPLVRHTASLSDLVFDSVDEFM